MVEKKAIGMSVRGAIRSLNPGESIIIQREDMKPSYLRTLCSALKSDEDKNFSVHKSDKGYIVTCYE